MGDTPIRWYSKIGTTIASGPCTTQVGVGVGETVGVGVTVGVEVTVIVLEGEAVSVGDGGVLGVIVGSGAASTAPPQAVNSKDTPKMMRTKCFILIL